MVLQMVDRTQVRPNGIIEDMIINIGRFIIPIDFVVLEYDIDARVVIILGRLFSATKGALTDMREGTLKMRLDDKRVVFKVYKTLNPPSHFKDLCLITLIEVKSVGWSPNHQRPLKIVT